jgi:hypothetical protein
MEEPPKKMFISSSGDMLKSGEENQYFVLPLGKVLDKENDAPIFEAIISIPCRCLIIE